MLKLLKDKATYETIIRYILGLAMLPYALTKLFRTQFIVLPFHEWSEPLERISGVTLTWAFLGYSKWFTVLLGVLELVPAILLLFRKTRLLGAILLLPVVLNVFLINIALDLWEGIQRISGVLLLLNIALLMFHFPILRDFVLKIFSIGSVKRIGVETAVNIVLIGIVSYFFLDQVLSYLDQRNFLTGDWYNGRPNVWVVTETTSAGEVNKINSPYEQGHPRYYFHPQDWVTEFLPGSNEPLGKAYKLDEEDQILKVFTKSDTLKGNYALMGKDTLEWMLENGTTMRLTRRELK
ncbi:DoxX family protein [Tunicatimonas pelagia]|uniref:DoxX family protein n=1 Tax=Tunicatimonas pelagia TaxID=931531 RepID=UPI002666DFE8|nr:DoxX family protein [Tunicatimonas pelagia]WKN45015.1 DoxX family protein [Tunicatimonas pelagia]